MANFKTLNTGAPTTVSTGLQQISEGQRVAPAASVERPSFDLSQFESMASAAQKEMSATETPVTSSRAHHLAKYLADAADVAEDDYGSEGEELADLLRMHKVPSKKDIEKELELYAQMNPSGDDKKTIEKGIVTHMAQQKLAEEDAKRMKEWTDKIVSERNAMMQA
jgi:hypothetical protein